MMKTAANLMLSLAVLTACQAPALQLDAAVAPKELNSTPKADGNSDKALKTPAETNKTATEAENEEKPEALSTAAEISAAALTKLQAGYPYFIQSLYRDNGHLNAQNLRSAIYLQDNLANVAANNTEEARNQLLKDFQDFLIGMLETQTEIANHVIQQLNEREAPEKYSEEHQQALEFFQQTAELSAVLQAQVESSTISPENISSILVPSEDDLNDLGIDLEEYSKTAQEVSKFLEDLLLDYLEEEIANSQKPFPRPENKYREFYVNTSQELRRQALSLGQILELSGDSGKMIAHKSTIEGLVRKLQEEHPPKSYRERHLKLYFWAKASLELLERLIERAEENDGEGLSRSEAIDSSEFMKAFSFWASAYQEVNNKAPSTD